MEKENINFYPDRGLMYLIQQTTKEPSEEILGFFYDFSKEAITRVLGSLRNNQNSFKRTIENYYPGTSIPFMIKVEGHLHWDHNSKAKVYNGARVSVSFPENTEYIDTKELINTIFEKELLGGTGSIPPFEPAETFASNGFKGLVKEVLGKRNAKMYDAINRGKSNGSELHQLQSEDYKKSDG